MTFNNSNVTTTTTTSSSSSTTSTSTRSHFDNRPYSPTFPSPRARAAQGELNPYDVPLEVRVWGRLACFTQPQSKVERISYPMLTPSAARGVLEAIYYHPGLDWVVEEIAVLRPIQYQEFTRREVNSRARPSNDGLEADTERTLRSTKCLKDVAYLIRANVYVREDADAAKLNNNSGGGGGGGGRRGQGQTQPGQEAQRQAPQGVMAQAKARSIFQKRVKRGSCFQRPYLGCREFACEFGPADPGEKPLPLTQDLGFMLLDMAYPDWPGNGPANIPYFFQASLQQGVLKVPPRPRK